MGPSLVAGHRLQRSTAQGWLLRQVAEVARAFPELDNRRIRVDLLLRGSLDGVAYPRALPQRVAFHVKILHSSHLPGVIAHELVHLIQRPDGPCPNGERACDLFALARCGERYRGPPSYLTLPAGTRSNWRFWAPLATLLARHAIAERTNGRRHYLVWWENEFAQRVSRARALPRGF